METQSESRSGPFIVTTKRLERSLVRRGKIRGRVGSGRLMSHRNLVTTSRQAVATLEEARIRIDRVMEEAGANGDWRVAVAVASLVGGGAVGPLPDGTVIEVEPTSHLDLLAMADLPEGWPDWSDTEIIAAYNMAMTP